MLFSIFISAHKCVHGVQRVKDNTVYPTPTYNVSIWDTTKYPVCMLYIYTLPLVRGVWGATHMGHCFNSAGITRDAHHNVGSGHQHKAMWPDYCTHRSGPILSTLLHGNANPCRPPSPRFHSCGETLEGNTPNFFSMARQAWEDLGMRLV